MWTIAEVRRQINAAPLGRYTLDTETGTWLHELLCRHPRGADKQAGGVAAYSIRPAVRGKGRSTWLERPCGHAEPWSWVKAARGADHSHEQLRTQAMRRAVEPQIQRFRVFNPRPPGHEWHVDHLVPFADIRDAYLERTPGLRLQPAHDGIGMEVVKLSAWDWPIFHKAHATLRWLPADENMRRGRG